MRDLDKQSTVNANFDKLLADKPEKFREADRTGYVRAWNRAGMIIKANRRKLKTGKGNPTGT